MFCADLNAGETPAARSPMLSVCRSGKEQAEGVERSKRGNGQG